MNKILSALLVLLLFAFHPPAFAGLNDGLVAYWSFDNCSAKDDSGNNIIGTMNNVSCIDGIKNKAFNFNGSNSSITTILPVVKKTYSVSMFVKFNSIDRVENQLFSLGKNRMGYLSTWRIGEHTWHWGSMDSEYDNSHWAERATTATDLSGLQANEWYHAVFLLNDTNISLYINGVLLKTIISPYHSEIESYSNLGFMLGGTPEGYQHMDGLIDELRIYNRALTDSEVAELYAQGQQTTTSNDILKDFIDLNKSTIDFSLNKIAVTFTKPVTALTAPNSPAPSLLGNYFNRVLLLVDGNVLSRWSFDDIKNQLADNQSNYVLLDLPDLTKYQDKLIQLQFIKRGVSGQLNAVTDRVVKFTPTAIINSRKIFDTKPINETVCGNQQGVNSTCNNLFNSAENGGGQLYSHFYGADFRNTLSHRLVDFDKIAPFATINKFWANTRYAKTPLNDNGRIPLLLIHGWQGDKNFRDPAQLGLWKNSELQYWRHFLDYYLATPALQNKYHVYLYHYPSYKHITYNANVLTEMLSELANRSPNSDLNVAMQSDKKGVVVLAHSMGGLVARSAIEEYQAFGASGEKLRHLITLDTPHHGSPAANPTFTAKLAKDLNTQGSADIQWDNFDLLYDRAAIDTQNAERWQTDNINSKDFDTTYEKACSSALCTITQNPWLVWLNTHFDSLKTIYSSKYLLYAGWMLNVEGVDNTGNIVHNGVAFGVADNVLRNSTVTTVIPTGIPSGGAEPVTSALWYELSPSNVAATPFVLNGSNNETPFYTDCLAKNDSWDATKWFAGVVSYLSVPIVVTAGFDTTACGNSILITKPKKSNHPFNFQYRVFWDYDHENMVNGAYPDGDGKLGTWDLFINKSNYLAVDVSADSAFLPNLLTTGGQPVRKDYVNIALGFKNRNEYFVYKQTDPNRYNPLTLEPLFNVLEGDLIRILP